MTIEELSALPKGDLKASESLTAQDVADLVEILNEKADAPRYQALLLLLARSEASPDVLPHWPRFCVKLGDANSYQRSIGIQMLAANARWADGEMVWECLPACLRLIEDEKPITARQAIQSLGKIAAIAPNAAKPVAEALMGLDPASVRETMRKLILLDICHALLPLTGNPDLRDSVQAFLMTALSGDILDKAAKKDIRQAMAL